KDGVARATQDGLQGDGIAQFVAFVDGAEIATIDEAGIRARLAAKPHDAAVKLVAARWFGDRGNTSEALGQLDAVGKEASATAAQRAEASASGTRLRRVAKWNAELVAEKLALARS